MVVSLSASEGVAATLGATELRQGYCGGDLFVIEEPDGSVWWWPSIMHGPGPLSYRRDFDVVEALREGLYPHNLYKSGS